MRMRHYEHYSQCLQKCLSINTSYLVMLPAMLGSVYGVSGGALINWSLRHTLILNLRPPRCNM
jgi:hypothetical protein